MTAREFRREDAIEQAALTAEAVGVQLASWSNKQGLLPADVMREHLRGL